MDGGEILTNTAEALLAQTDEHVQAEIAIGWPVKVLQAPNMVAIVLHVLLGTAELQQNE